MENERGLESGGVSNEIIGMNNGEVEGFAGEKIGERREKGGETVKQGNSGLIASAGANDGGASEVALKDTIQGDLVNLTTRDGEKIEKEWVDKVKTVMKETRENPKKREDDIFEVKKDFIQKRFGRTIGEGR